MRRMKMRLSGKAINCTKKSSMKSTARLLKSTLSRTRKMLLPAPNLANARYRTGNLPDARHNRSMN